MFRSALRASSWRSLPSRPVQIVLSRRFLNTKVTPRKSRTWKSTVFRWALVIGGVYYYNTHDLFAQEPEVPAKEVVGIEDIIPETSQITVDAVIEQKRQRQAQKLAEQQSQAKKVESKDSPAQVLKDDEVKQEKEEKAEDSIDETPSGQEGAFDPETGNINWDCPCLGGMAHGPCGEEFKAAFSCFVHSEEEPKGVECIDKFKDMQTCFRKYPEIYGAELDDEISESEKGSGKVLEDTNKPSEVSEQILEPLSPASSESTDLKSNLRKVSAPDDGNKEL